MTRDNYNWYKLHHICVGCGHENAVKGKTMCIECLEKDSQKHRDKRASKKYHTEENYHRSESGKKLYELRIAFGVCTKCGKRDATPGRVKCSCCLYKEKEYAIARRRANGIYARDSYLGMCMTCGKNPTIPGKKLCASCYEKSFKSLEKARKTVDKNNNIFRSLETARIAEVMSRKKLSENVSKSSCDRRINQ